MGLHLLEVLAGQLAALAEHRVLGEDEIPVTGRIVAVADVFDALTHVRPYKPAWSVADAVAEIRSQAGRHFDPVAVDAFAAAQEERVTV